MTTREEQSYLPTHYKSGRRSKKPVRRSETYSRTPRSPIAWKTWENLAENTLQQTIAKKPRKSRERPKKKIATNWGHRSSSTKPSCDQNRPFTLNDRRRPKNGGRKAEERLLEQRRSATQAERSRAKSHASGTKSRTDRSRTQSHARGSESHAKPRKQNGHERSREQRAKGKTMLTEVRMPWKLPERGRLKTGDSDRQISLIPLVGAKGEQCW